MSVKKVLLFSHFLILTTLMACRDGMEWSIPFIKTRLSLTSFDPCQTNLILRLRGGKDTGIPEVEDEKYAQREAVWQKWREEWEYCTAVEDGRPLNPIAEEYPISPELYECDLNLDGNNPGPEVWRNPPQEFRDEGFRVDPATAPITELIADVRRQMEEAEAEEERVRHEGPDLYPPQEAGEDGVPMYQYWDREAGTRPWPNLRRSLPPGWHQVKMAGSCVLLAPDGSFVHTDDPNNHDPSTWGADVSDRGTWSCDGPSWEESQLLTLRFHDEERTEVNMHMHCEKTWSGQTWAYTGEDPVRDAVLEEPPVTPNIHAAAYCDDEDCPACAELQRSETEPESGPDPI